MPSLQNFNTDLLLQNKIFNIILYAAVLTCLNFFTFKFEFNSTVSAEPAPFLEPGSKAPVTTLERLEGGRETFPEKGKWNLVFFWSLFCQSCLEELPLLAEETLRFSENSVKSVFVSIDTDKMKTALKNYLLKRKLSINVVLDKVVASSAYEAADAWGVRPTPAVFVINPEGVVVYSHEGPFDPKEVFEPLEKNLAAGKTGADAVSSNSCGCTFCSESAVLGCDAFETPASAASMPQ